MPLLIHKLIVGQLQTNCYIVSCENSGFTFIIDPGDDSRKIIQYVRRNEYIPKAVILTHGHFDHIGGVKMMHEEFGVPVMMHPDDQFMLSLCGISHLDQYLVNGMFLNLGREKFTVIHTPGHSPGSVCLHGEGVLFSGDTLFMDGVGRTDLPGGSAEQLAKSLRKGLFVLPEETIVYPGHGSETTIAREQNQ